MFKDMFTILGYTVQTHAVVSIIAIILGYGVGLALTKDTKYYKHFSGFIMYGVVGGMIGARIWHVFIFQWPYYSENPGAIFAIWKGGISIEGAIVGGVVALFIYTAVHKINFWDMADYLAPALILGQGIGRIAELLAGDVFGKPTGGDFGVIYPKETIAYEYYQNQPLWPADIWESQGNFVIFAILFMVLSFYKKKLADGSVFLLYVFMYFTERFLLEFIRGDSPRFASLTGGQWSALVLIAASIIIFLIFVAQGRYKQELPKKPNRKKKK